MARMVVETPSGNKLFFGGGGPVIGLSEVGIGTEIATASSAAFKGALATLGELVAMLEESLGRMPKRPDKVEMEFRASLSGECDLWIVSGNGEAEFKVTLTWNKSE